MTDQVSALTSGHEHNIPANLQRYVLIPRDYVDHHKNIVWIQYFLDHQEYINDPSSKTHKTFLQEIKEVSEKIKKNEVEHQKLLSELASYRVKFSTATSYLDRQKRDHAGKENKV
jgi:hypothetical protein